MVNNYGWVASEFHSNMFKETQPKTLDVSQRFRPWLVVKIAVSHTDGDSPTESCTVRLMVENDGKRLISRDSSVNTSGPFAPNRKRHTHTHTHIEEKFKFHSGGRHAGFFYSFCLGWEEKKLRNKNPNLSHCKSQINKAPSRQVCRRGCGSICFSLSRSPLMKKKQDENILLINSLFKV